MSQAVSAEINSLDHEFGASRQVLRANLQPRILSLILRPLNGVLEAFLHQERVGKRSLMNSLIIDKIKTMNKKRVAVAVVEDCMREMARVVDDPLSKRCNLEKMSSAAKTLSQRDAKCPSQSRQQLAILKDLERTRKQMIDTDTETRERFRQLKNIVDMMIVFPQKI